MRRVVWSPAAVEDLAAIGDYISTFNPGAAARFQIALISAGEGLAVFSDRGRPVPSGIRELTIIRPWFGT
jgi:toxin ParE1/3/4